MPSFSKACLLPGLFCCEREKRRQFSLSCKFLHLRPRQSCNQWKLLCCVPCVSQRYATDSKAVGVILAGANLPTLLVPCLASIVPLVTRGMGTEKRRGL